MKKIILIIASVLLIAIIALVGVVYYFTKKPVPIYSGQISLKNLNCEVEVYFDDFGIPHIIAKDEQDLFRTAGYIVARERMWQMDLIRRATQGKLSEIFGKDFLQTDLLLRALNIEATSYKIYENLPLYQKNLLLAYSDGINQYIEQFSKKLPFEFVLLGYKPQKWLPQHSLNIIGFMAWDLETAWDYKFPLVNLKSLLDSSIFRYFVPNFDTSTTIYCSMQPIENPYKNVVLNLKKLGINSFTASNNWVVNGKKTTTGKPILCNDMHLGYSIPGIWYQMHLIIEGKLNVTGVSIPGAPGIISGHNSYIAWGLTNVMLDGADFYVETINDDTSKYLIDGQWKDIRVTLEKIPVGKKDTVVKKLFWTHRGPIISMFKDVTNKAISMNWVGYIAGKEMEGIYIINNAHRWNEFLRGVGCFKAISQNFVYADIVGNIGIKMSGSVPIRNNGVDFIYKGDTSIYDWQNFVPFDSLPVVFNPQNNFLASANNKSSNTFKYYISDYFYQDYRYDRIYELLSSNDSIDNSFMQLLVADQKSKLAQKLMPFILKNINLIENKDKTDQILWDILKNWNYELSSKSSAALFFEVFNMFFVKNVVADELGKDNYLQVGSAKILFNNLLENLVKDTSSILYDNIQTQHKETFDDIFVQTYYQTKDFLVEKFGKSSQNWHYGKQHQFTLKHPLSKVKIVDLLFDLKRGPYQVGGSNHTVCPYSYSLVDTNMTITSGASQRHIYDLSNWDNSLTVIPTGQSGLPMSKYYCSQTQMFVNGKFHYDIFSVENVRKIKNKLIIKNN